MTRIYHILARATWEQRPTGPYRAPSLDSEGFIHCSYAGQVARVANMFYRHEPDLMVLGIDPELLSSQVLAEDPGVGEKFPHVYGPLDSPAVVEILPLQRNPAGLWEFAADS